MSEAQLPRVLESRVRTKFVETEKYVVLDAVFLQNSTMQLCNKSNRSCCYIT